MSVYKDIQRCKRFGKEKSATARELGLARGTVRKFWNMDTYTSAFIGLCVTVLTLFLAGRRVTKKLFFFT